MRRRAMLWGLVAIGWLVVPAIPLWVTEPVRTSVLDRLIPSLGLVNVFGRRGMRLIQWRRFVREYDVVRADRDRLVSEAVAGREAIEENRRLRDLLAFQEHIDFATIPALVVGRDPLRWTQSVVINKGAADGVRSGCAVITPAGVLGTIRETGHHSAKVFLLRGPASRVSALVQRTRDSGLLVGSADGSLQLLYLPKTTTAAAGDVVVTAGYGGTYPKGLLIGTIESLQEEVDGLSVTAVIQPEVSSNRIEGVLVVKQE